MSDLPRLFLDNLLPIALAATAGFFLARWLPIDTRTLSNITFYLFSPFLIFTILVDSQLSNGDLGQMMLFTVVCVTSMGAIAWLVGRGLKLDRKLLVAFVITGMLMNAGNYGLPVTSFAFGEEALAYAGVFFVTNAMLTYSLGVLIVSMGSVPFLTACKNLLKVPALWGLLLGLVFIMTGWKLPVPLERTAKLLSNAAIPTMVVLLGIQLRSARLSGRWIPLGMVSLLRLVISPLLAIGLSALFALSPTARQAAVIEAGMPAAVLTTILATQYDTEPSFVTAVVAVTTISSLVTLPPIMVYLGG